MRLVEVGVIRALAVVVVAFTKSIRVVYLTIEFINEALDQTKIGAGGPAFACIKALRLGAVGAHYQVVKLFEVGLGGEFQVFVQIASESGNKMVRALIVEFLV